MTITAESLADLKATAAAIDSLVRQAPAPSAEILASVIAGIVGEG